MEEESGGKIRLAMSNSPWHGRGLHTEKGVSDLVHGATYTRVVCHLCNKDTLEADTQKDTLVSARWMTERISY